MNGIRARKTRRNKRINSTKFGQKRKRKNKKNVKIANETILKNWDQSKTLKQNFHEMGLASNANAVIPILKKKKPSKKTDLEGEEEMEIERQPTEIVKEFEKLASVEVKTERRIAPGEAQFVWKLIQKHGEDYKKMAKDKENFYQHTAKQLKRKCESFLRSSQDFSEHLKDT